MDLPERISPPFSLADYPDIIDVRSPSEFEEDHVPGAISLPVLTDEERHTVGDLNAQNPYEARRLGATPDHKEHPPSSRLHSRKSSQFLRSPHLLLAR